MATEKELRHCVEPVERKFPGWRYHRGWLFQLPIGYYVRGIAFERSWSDRRICKVLQCVYPLYESLQSIHIGWGESHPLPRTHNHGWNIFHPSFSETLMELMEKVIIPATADITKGSDFLRYLAEHRCSHGWPDWGKALARVHMGDLTQARDLLLPYAHTIRTRFPELQAPGVWGHNLIELLRLVEENPHLVPTHCEAIARQSVQINKLQQFWEPASFVYDRDCAS